MKNFILFLVIISIMFSCQEKSGPVSEHGLLKVDGNKIVNKNNVPISLAGMSMFWSNNGWDGEKFYKKSQVDYFANDWNVQIIRAAMAIDERGGYTSEKVRNLAKIETIIQAAIANDIYVIVDFHSHHAEDFQDVAIEVFSYLAEKYGDSPHIIYEIYNEPLDVSWDTVLKPYSLKVIEAIRKYDPNNMIIVGTPNWSQDVEKVINNPITEYENIAYTLHFYAATHKERLRAKADAAIQSGLPLFVSEWGTIEANGDGDIDHESVNAWLSWMKKNNLSHCNWSVCDKAEGASVFQPNIGAQEKYSAEDLTKSGTYVRSIIQEWNAKE